MARKGKHQKRSQGESGKPEGSTVSKIEQTSGQDKFDQNSVADETGEDLRVESNENSSTRETNASDFASFYLRKVTMELEDDLDKIRSSGDFKQSSLPVLIEALRQGEAIFSEDEKRQVMGTGL